MKKDVKRVLVLSGLAAVTAGLVWAAEPINDLLRGQASLDGVQMAANTTAGRVTPAPKFTPAADPLSLQRFDRVLGSADAPVTIIEYASMTCSHCRDLHMKTLPEVQKNWIATGKARYVLRDLPWDNMALGMAATARCAPATAYYPLVSSLFAAQEDIFSANDKIGAIAQVAGKVGMSRAKVEACIRDDGYQALVNGMKADALSRLGVKGTPATFVNGTKLEGFVSYADMNKALNEAYAKAAR